MEINEMQKGIEEIKKIRMKKDEKEKILQNILETSSKNLPIKSPWGFLFFFSKHTYAIAITFLILFCSTGIVFASQDSLPNSILYPIKINIIEPIQSSLVSSPLAKAKYESSLATKRLVEAETLANRGELDEVTEKKLDNLLEKHSLSLSKKLADLKSEDSDEIATDFHAEMDAHAKLIEILKRNNTQSQDQNNISNQARDNAEKISEMKGKENTQEGLSKKKEKIKKIIDEVSQTLQQKDPTKNNEMIENTNKTLEQAKEYLKKADENEQEGKEEDAYHSLIDSEKSAKEANIFFKNSLKIEQGENKFENKD